MALKRVQLVSIALAMALAGVGGISYVRPLITAFPLSHNTQYRLTVADGNLRLVWLRAEFMASYIGETPLEAYGRMWDDAQTYPFRWEQRKVRLFDRTLIDRFEIGCTLFAPLILLLLVLFVVRPIVRHKRRVRFILAELWHASNRQGRTVWRCCRHLVLAGLTFGAMVTALAWAVSYDWIPHSIQRAIDSRSEQIFWSADSATLLIGTGPFAEPLHSVTVFGGTIALASSFRVPTDTVVPTRDMEHAGFGWKQGIRPPLSLYDGLNGGTAEEMAVHYRVNRHWLTPATIEKLFRTKEHVRSVWFPLWAPFALCSIWPVLAFFRGPWQRSGRRIKGLCLGCGYNLTGLVEPRCPECGRPTPPGQIAHPLPATTPP